VLVLAGIGLGLSHRSPDLAALAWIALALLAVGLARTVSKAPVLVATGMAAVCDLWIAHPWQLGSAAAYSGGSGWVTLAIVVGFTAVHVLAKWTPVLLGWWWWRHRPATLWLPAVWIAGEALRDRLTLLGYNDWLYTQWQSEAVLRTLGLIGWMPTAWLCLTAAVALGEAWDRRSWRLAAVAAVAGGILHLAPPLPQAPPSLLHAVGAVHMTGYYHPPQGAPPGIKLVVWPEQVTNQQPWLPEGPGHGKRIDTPFRAPGVSHLYGLITRSALGKQNAVLLVDPVGTIVASRAKVRLFPLTERPVWGVRLPAPVPLIHPGELPAVLPTPLGPVLSLVCLEGLARDYIAAEVRHGARLVAVCANDRVLTGSPTAMVQFTAVTAMCAAENGVPVFRSSLFGRAVIADADGTILAISPPGTDGVLTVAGDVMRPYPPAP
jgi:apolipoprotein N-acyltransferase